MARKSSKVETAVPTVDREWEWEARNDADSLRRAGEIMGDKARMKAAERMMAKDMRAMEKVMHGGAKPSGNSLGFAKGKK